LSAELHFEATGPADAPVVLLSGSLGSSLAVWEPQVAALGERSRVVRFDHRGHGGSPAPPGPYALEDLGSDVLALMDSLEIERASWCGLSLGGMVGMWLAAHAPERIERLVLLCTAAHMPDAPWAERAEAVRAAGSVEVVADTVVERWLTPRFAASHPEVRARLRAMLVASDPEGYAACCGAIERMDLRDDLGRVTAPTLVIAGSEDASTPPETVRAIADTIGGARFELLEPAAHIASVERAGEVNRLLADWLQ